MSLPPGTPIPPVNSGHNPFIPAGPAQGSVPGPVPSPVPGPVQAPAPVMMQPVAANNPLNEFKDEWSKSMDHMKGNLANMARLLMEMRSLLEELKNLIGPQVPASIDDLINAVDATSVSTHDLNVKLNDVNGKINNLQISGLTANHPALQTLVRIKEKLSEMLRLSMANSPPQLNAVGQPPQVNTPSSLDVIKSILFLMPPPHVNTLNVAQKSLIVNELQSQIGNPFLKMDLEAFFSDGVMNNFVQKHFETVFFQRADQITINKYNDLSIINLDIKEKEAICHQMNIALNPPVGIVHPYNELNGFLIAEKNANQAQMLPALVNEINAFTLFGTINSPSLLGTAIQNYLPTLNSKIQELKARKQNLINNF